MAFNHYAKIKRILENEPTGWYIKRINQPTVAKNFKGELREFPHYYRAYSVHNKPIKYCKFQQLDKFLQVMKLDETQIILLDE